MGSDVLVVGGGPAGLYASLLLARHGYKVTVIEEHAEIGSPVHCTGILGTEAFDQFDLPRESILNTLSRVRFYSPRGDSFQYSAEKLAVVVIDRQIFDHSLAVKALNSGVILDSAQKVVDIKIQENEAVVETTKDVYRARAVVLACGGNYVLQRRLGLGGPSTHLQTCQVELPANASGDVELHFGRRVAPKGFAWVVPFLRDECPHVRVGVISDLNALEYFDRFFTDVAPRWGLDRLNTIQPRRKILPLGPIQKTFSRRLLVIGDAAGVVKPTTGGGIHYSIATAALAVRVLSSALATDRLDEVTLSSYETFWRNEFGSEVETQLKFRSLAENLEDGEINELFHLARTNGILPLVRRTIQFNYHREFIVELLKHPQARAILLHNVIGG